MNSKKTDESTTEPSTKRPYRAPEVRELGTVTELTLSGGSQPVGDGQPTITTHKQAP